MTAANIVSFIIFRSKDMKDENYHFFNPIVLGQECDERMAARRINGFLAFCYQLLIKLAT